MRVTGFNSWMMGFGAQFSRGAVTPDLPFSYAARRLDAQDPIKGITYYSQIAHGQMMSNQITMIKSATQG